MYYILVVLINLLIAVPAVAEPPSGIIKVTPENNPKCVEYVSYHDEMYCTTKAVENTAVDPNILSYEKQRIVFDDRAWKAAWGKSTEKISTVEYLPLGDDINNWNELITSQFIPAPAQVTPKIYTDYFIDNMKKSGIKANFHMIKETPEQILIEFNVDKPSNLAQDELQQITKGPLGLYILHYAIKKPDMGDVERSKWIKLLQQSTVK